MKNRIEELAGTAYGAYCKAVGGVAFNGDKLPSWEDFRDDPQKEKQVDAWKAAASAMLERALDHDLEDLGLDIAMVKAECDAMKQRCAEILSAKAQ